METNCGKEPVLPQEPQEPIGHSLFCLVDGEPTSNAFSIRDIPSSDTVDNLKQLIKARKANDFHKYRCGQTHAQARLDPLAEAYERDVLMLNVLDSKEELRPLDDISDVLPEGAAKKTIHTIVQRPPPAAPVNVPGHLLQESRLASPPFDSDVSESTPVMSPLSMKHP
ncbi:hypothetical protein BC939DRAFT_499608 [Gamsiella multidivaricata]|uniref:uncharacterized protein n=1 Tax=Gamsiella multidivaricata TaxID=101098 RepID=UPI00221FA119|nr:uncharacterized protein BC939DRAFT_499608 [Gamsiella multidivaricata]KAI7830484.1 hypothetical protein BC939DRAFT_499608 [Gamsiella multidivaricata]